MSEFECPDCGGGFPKPSKWQTEWVCPWCYNALFRHHNAPQLPLERMLGEYQ